MSGAEPSTGRLARMAGFADFARVARRRIPRVVFDYVDAGAGTDLGVRRNREALDDVLLTPRFFRDVTERDTGAAVFGRRYDLPVGIAPMGMGNLIWPQADSMLAKAAVRANIPYVLSTAGTTSMEDIARIAPDHLWYQLYPAQRDEVTFDLLSRAANCGVSTLVVTIDAPIGGQRHRDVVNGFTLPLAITPTLVWDFLSHPAWALAMARQGAPVMANVAPYAQGGKDARSLAAYMASHVTTRFDAQGLRRIRDKWAGKLLVKGVMCAEDARLSLESGADGVIASNHGGRQLEAAPATVHALAEIRKAVGSEAFVAMDGGIRSGHDIARTFARGADFTLIGRGFMFAAAAGGAKAIDRFVEILRNDLHEAMALTGKTTLAAGLAGGQPRDLPGQ